MKYRTAPLAVLAAIAAFLVHAPWASAEDLRPCVSNVEWNHQSDYRQQRLALEKFWDVRGLGRSELHPMFTVAHTHVVKYRRCGFSLAISAIDVYYSDNTRQLDVAVNRWRIGGAIPDGQPRVLAP